MKRIPYGFSIIETSIASALLVIVLSGILSLFMSGMKPLMGQMKTEKSKLEIRLSFAKLNRDLFNAAQISPEEDLISSSDMLYRGFASLSSHSKCRFAIDSTDSTHEQFSIFRSTTAVRKVMPEELLKAWNFKDNPDDLRISFNLGSAYMFQPTDIMQIKEVVIIDIDGNYRARFKVNSATHKVASGIDPYTLTTPDPPKTFPPWTLLSVSRPKSASGSTLDGADFNFISNSLVYPTTTSIYCVDATKNSIIQYDENTDQVTTIFEGDIHNVDIVRFEMRYLNSVKADRLELSKFFLFPTGDMTKRRCINHYALTLELKDKDPNATTNSILKFKNMGVMHTLAAHRPADCEP